MSLDGSGFNGDDDNSPVAMLAREIREAHLHNPWFIPSFTHRAFSVWELALRKDNLRAWLGEYDKQVSRQRSPRTVALVMAGNIPAVGMHDLLCCIASGHNLLIRLSSEDDRLIPAILRILYEIEPSLENRVKICEGPLKDFDAIIATGSNNSARYFEYYFRKYPHIIRKNRNGVAVINGSETGEELKLLADDIFTYFGLGCRSVSKVYLPEGFSMPNIWPHLKHFSFVQDHHKYRNNYDYQKTVMIINNIPHEDNGFLMARENNALISPVSVLHYEYYYSIDFLNRELQAISDQIQCVVSNIALDTTVIPFGQSQFPALWDYADGEDTMEFLLNI
ncbi:MAG: acyl-CoA reductase [Bacteroidales bacterium]|nr:acyl-CoA reductase [Bacteroidales bacterium]